MDRSGDGNPFGGLLVAGAVMATSALFFLALIGISVWMPWLMLGVSLALLGAFVYGNRKNPVGLVLFALFVLLVVGIGRPAYS